MPGITSNVIKAGVQLSLLDRLTPEMRRTLATNKGLLNSFSQATNQQNMFGPMAQANMAQYERGMARIATSQKLLQTGMIGLGASVAAQLYTGNAFVKFEDDMAYIDTILDGKIKAIDRFGKDVLRISRTTGTEIAEVSKGAYQALSSEVPQEYLMGFTEQMAKVAMAGRTSVENATKSTLSVLNAYGMGANKQSVDWVSDMLFETVNRGIIEYNELSGVLSEFTASGALAGMKIEDMLAALATLTLSGKSGSESGTQLNRFVLSVISASDEIKKFAKTLGIDFNISHLREVGLPKFLEEVQNGIGGNEEALNRLFPEVRAFTMVAPLIGNMKDTFLDISEGMQNTAGATETAVGKMTDTMKHKMDIVSQSFESIKISVGEIFAEQYGPGLAQFAGYLGDIAQNETAMENIAGAIKGITGIFAAMGAVGLLGKAVGAIDVGVAGFKTALSTGKLVANGGGLAFLGSGLGKLTGLFGGGSAAASGTTAAISGGGAGYGAPLGASAMPATGATTLSGTASVLLRAVPMAALMTAATIGALELGENSKDRAFDEWTKKDFEELRRVKESIDLLRENNDLNFKNAAKNAGYGLQQLETARLEHMMPEGMMEDLRKLTHFVGPDYARNIGFGYARPDSNVGTPYEELDEAKKRRMVDFANQLKEIYGVETMAVENMYSSQIQNKYKDPEIASAIPAFVAAGLVPDLAKEFHSQYAEEQSVLQEIEQKIQKGSLPGAKQLFPQDEAKLNHLVKSSYQALYKSPLSSRYQYNSELDSPKIMTFEEMFEKKPEKDDWQIVVNINGQETTAELRKNGSSVKSIESIVNDFKEKNSFRRNPAYIEKPR
jgi:TP901 family phage tail tape measure protein